MSEQVEKIRVDHIHMAREIPKKDWLKSDHKISVLLDRIAALEEIINKASERREDETVEPLVDSSYTGQIAQLKAQLQAARELPDKWRDEEVAHREKYRDPLPLFPRRDGEDCADELEAAIGEGDK